MGRSRIEQFKSHSDEETIAFGKQLGQQFQNGTIVCLFGDLGAGKTTLIRGIAEGVCQNNDLSVSSPTFVYLNIYSGKSELYHFDLYRLRDVDEFLSMGFDEYLYSEGIVCIEWSERIQSILPQNCIEISLKHDNQHSRVIEVSYP